MKNIKKMLLFLPFLIAGLLLAGCEQWQPPALYCAHEYHTASTVPATCAEEGYRMERCALCDRENKVVLPKVGHDYQTFTTDATCTEEGKTFQECRACGDTVVLSTEPKLPHAETVQIIEATCTTDGYTLTTCKNCDFSQKSEYVERLGHRFGAWVTVKPATDFGDGLQERTCTECLYTEEQIILSTAYIDRTCLKEPFDENTVYEIGSYEELSVKFQTAIIRLADSFSCKLNYEVEDLNTLLDDLLRDYDAIFSFGVGAELKNNVLTFTFTHQAEPHRSSGTVYYTQYDSLNKASVSAGRPADYDGFAINDSIYSFEVSTSDQLFYVLEHGVRPICKEGSNAERVYEAMKSVLRECVNDGMTDAEKIKVIHDWLVMSVTYDNALYRLLGSNAEDLKTYNGFYLEGAVLDGLAVCEGISKAFASLCNIEGIPCVSVEGYQTQNPAGARHAWNKVCLDGDWYIVDVTSDGTVIGGVFEVLSYQYYLIDEATYQTVYTGENFTDLVCDKRVNVYANMQFSHAGDTADCVIVSQEELDVLVAYLESVETANLTVEFQIAFDCGDSAADEISQAYRNNGISGGYRYIENGDIVMLIK